jgi:3-hydroxyacyl-[acyl-carrier-protein] dehydratase
MLLNDFYKLIRIDTVGDTISGEIRLNSTHPIFRGHFPDLPVVPGVVLVQIVKEIVAFESHSQYAVEEIPNVKFLDFINPLEVQELQFEILKKTQTVDVLKIQARIYTADKVNFKLKVNLKPIEN